MVFRTRKKSIYNRCCLSTYSPEKTQLKLNIPDTKNLTRHCSLKVGARGISRRKRLAKVMKNITLFLSVIWILIIESLMVEIPEASFKRLVSLVMVRIGTYKFARGEGFDTATQVSSRIIQFP